jgi:hypothetical protein
MSVTPDTPSTEARPETEHYAPADECSHPSVLRLTSGDGAARLWGCDDCGRRFYPACPTCVTVGHRGERHE